MKKWLALAVSAGLFAAPVASAAGVDQPPPAAVPDGGTVDRLTVEQQLEDFDLMRAALEEAHTGLYRYSTKDHAAATPASIRTMP